MLRKQSTKWDLLITNSSEDLLLHTLSIFCQYTASATCVYIFIHIFIHVFIHIHYIYIYTYTTILYMVTIFIVLEM